MTAYLILIILLTFFVSFLVKAEFDENRKRIYIFKPISSALLIVIAALSILIPQQHDPVYSIAILIGLLFSFGGDIALMFRSRQSFMTGLVLFLLGHVVYFVTFTFLNSFFVQNYTTVLILIVLAIVIFAYLYPGLGNMRYPVLMYILVISAMMLSAVNTFESEYFSLNKAVFITIGAALFYISDIILAINKFRKPFRYNRISLAFYYGGQLLIALSASSLKW